MNNQTAEKPLVLLAKLIDERQVLTADIEALELRKKALAKQIVDAMKTLNLTKAYGSQGKGYQLTESIKAEYPEKAVQYTIKQRIDHLFRSEPNITRSKVMSFLKKKLITEVQFRYLQRVAGQDYTDYTLKMIDEESKA